MNPNSPDPIDDAADLGEPIEVLRTQEDIPPPDFIGKVRRKIHRRAAAGQFASYSWQVPKVVFIEAVNVLGHVVRTIASSKEPPK